jgi:DNA-binding CsgD family transcriptional regulator
VPDLDRYQPGRRAGAGHRDQGVDRLARQHGEREAVTGHRYRVFRFHVQVAERGHGHGRDRVVDGPERAQRGEHVVGLSPVADVVRLHDDERPAPDLRRDGRERREPQEPAHRGQLVRRPAGQPGPGVQHLGSAFDRVPQRPGVRLGDREQAELQGGHDAEAAAAAAQRPEQVGLVLVVGPHQVPAGPGSGSGPVSAAVPGLVEQPTSRELEVLGMLAAGKSNQAIASQLFVTLDTVKKHVSHLLGKLGAENRTEAVTRARELGMIP